ncbi:hypothetical protein BGX27_000273 [Mortierella sp. AM989]|nr:hypothetical protein BGX27_000273 [Mortierella sp. AM989]
MTAVNPLDLPEIWLHILNYLKGTDMVRCLCVCQVWHRMILPRVWSNVIIDINTIPTQPQGPSPDSLLHHCELVKRLDINSEDLGIYNFIYPRLHTLSLGSGPLTGYKISYGGDPTSLVSLNRSLVHLHLHGFNGYLVAGFWRAVASLPLLKTLYLFRATMKNKDDIEAFWSMCTKLESIHIMASSIEACNSELTDLTFPKTRFLELRLLKSGRKMDPVDLILRFPQLVGLKWYAFENQSLDKFARTIAQGRWPSLEKLSLNYNIADESMSPIIEGMRRITSLDVSSNYLGPLTFQALQRHFSTLVELSLQECSGVESKMFQMIMCSCPRLETLSGSAVRAVDVINGEPWTCLSLKTLQVCFEFYLEEQDLQHLIFERLATLNQLEYLGIGKNGRNCRKFQEALDLRLQSGLGALTKLKNIRQLNFCSTEQALHRSDILWMLSNWRRLQAVFGGLHQDRVIKDSLVSILRAHDVVTG